MRFMLRIWPSKKVWATTNSDTFSCHTKKLLTCHWKKNHESTTPVSELWIPNPDVPISDYLFFLVNFNLKLNRGDFNYFSSLSLKQFFTVNDTPFPIAIVRKTTPPLFFGRSFRLLLLLPFSPDLSWAILHHPQLNVCKDHSWFYYRGILSPVHARTWHFLESLTGTQKIKLA